MSAPATKPGEEVVLMKDRDGRDIGFEKLNFRGPADGKLSVSLEIGRS